MVPIVVELVVDGEDVRSEAGRRRLMLLPSRHWLPDVEGVLRIDVPEVPDGFGEPRLAYDWRVQGGGSMPGFLADRFGAALARTVVRGAARLLEEPVRSAGGGGQAGLGTSR